MQKEINLPQMLTVKEAADKTHISGKLIRKLIEEKKIKYINTGRKYLINAESLCDYLNCENQSRGCE